MATPGEFKKLPTPYRIGLTMYEADSPLGVHPEWERDCQNVDRLFVPSKYCRDVFSRFVKRDITVVPLATNLEFNVGPSRIYNHDRPFTFFTHGTLTSRKSPLELIDCFKKAFPNKEDVRLVLKTRMGILGMGKGDLPRLDDPRIKIYPDEDWFPSRLSAEFLASDAYVFPSKGEGFGMTPREAMASGLPTIFTNSTGLKDIADDKYNWPIPYKERVYTQVMGGEWYIPDWDYLIDTMRWVVSNREEAAAKAQEGSRWIIREWGHDAVAREWRKALSGVDPSKTARNLKGATEALSLETFPKIEATHTEFLKAIEATCPRGSKLLNLGVGSGFLYAALQKRGYEVFGVADPGVPVDTGLIRRITGRAPSIEKSVLLGLGRNSRVALQPSAIVSQGVFQHFYDQEIKVILREAIRKYPRVPILLSIPSIHFEGTYDVTSRHLALDNWWNILSEFALSRSGYYSPGKAHMLFVITGLAVVIRASPHRSIGMVNDGVWRPVDARRAL
jgi:SAM-dependent methyltransferase